MRLPFALASLDWIVPRDVQGARIVLELDGQRGWMCRTGHGYCVGTSIAPATHVPPPLMQSATSAHLALPVGTDAVAVVDTDTILPGKLTHLSLVLAGQPALRDDSLCLANGTLWWVHRFDGDEPAAQVEATLRRQLLACAMAAAPSPSPTPSSIDAAHACRHRMALRRC